MLSGLREPVGVGILTETMSGPPNRTGKIRHPRLAIEPGQRCGGLTAISYQGQESKHGLTLWLFRCDCGELEVRIAYSVLDRLSKGGYCTCKKCRCAQNDKRIRFAHEKRKEVYLRLWESARSLWHPADDEAIIHDLMQEFNIEDSEDTCLPPLDPLYIDTWMELD